MQQNKDVFLWLVRMGIKAESANYQPKITEAATVNWDAIQDLATHHGLSAVVLDGIEQLPEQQRPPKLFRLEWIGETLQGYEYRYELYQRAIAELAAFYNNHGFKMMVLKGYTCCLDWPKPEHRPCGDIDIWMFGRQKEADAILEKEKGLEIDLSHHHHTVFYWHDFMVENHFDFVNVHSHSSSRELEPILKQLGQDASHTVEIYGEKVYLPSPDLHALFLMRHAAAHFASANINLRQVLDWAFFVQKHTKEIHWERLLELLEKFHMIDFYNCINAICVEDLGFPVCIFPQVQFAPDLKERVLQDILSPQYGTEPPKGLVKRLVFKVKRWKSNAWKRDLCFEEKGLFAFLTSIWSHLLRTNSI